MENDADAVAADASFFFTGTGDAPAAVVRRRRDATGGGLIDVVVVVRPRFRGAGAMTNDERGNQ